MPYRSIFKIQLTVSGGFLYEWQGAVLRATMMSAFRDFCRAMTAIFTDRKLFRCSGPPSLYSTIIVAKLSPYLAVKTDLSSAAFLNAEDESVSLIFRNMEG